MKKSIITIGLVVTIVAIIQSCKKDQGNVNNPLYSEITSSGYTYYQNGSILSSVSPSTHGSFKLRFNSTAFAVLDSIGELPVGNSFPTGSVIVKEMYNGSIISLYAVMKKDPSNVNSASGWVWADFNTNGSIAFDPKKRGSACVGCHSDAPNRDLTRTFDLH